MELILTAQTNLTIYCNFYYLVACSPQLQNHWGHKEKSRAKYKYKAVWACNHAALQYSIAVALSEVWLHSCTNQKEG